MERRILCSVIEPVRGSGLRSSLAIAPHHSILRVNWETTPHHFHVWNLFGDHTTLPLLCHLIVFSPARRSTRVDTRTEISHLWACRQFFLGGFCRPPKATVTVRGDAYTSMHMWWVRGQRVHESTRYTQSVVLLCWWVVRLANRQVLEQGRGQTGDNVGRVPQCDVGR